MNLPAKILKQWFSKDISSILQDAVFVKDCSWNDGDTPAFSDIPGFIRQNWDKYQYKSGTMHLFNHPLYGLMLVHNGNTIAWSAVDFKTMDLEEAKRWVEERDYIVAENWAGFNGIQEIIDQVENYWKTPTPNHPCHRGLYSALVVRSLNNYDVYVVDGPYLNYVPVNLRDMCCPRDELGQGHFNANYICPAIHAAQQLSADDVDNNSIWIESGWKSGERLSLKGTTYPCIRCMTHCAGRGIKALMWIDEGGVATFHDVEAHISMYMLNETYKAKETI